ncbi:complement C1r subcomponent-like protein isoform X2 [Phacochoerus africanus]|uniref:complement C1r subcomponent-like protein isoform X2 n=1 Tax=Phacochoerus africanus TaxID=41426 RepID=UPI001FD8F5E7|nr:complement C1r subcomponent-like protein isoform X2 [Phacochoerus africanus]
MPGLRVGELSLGKLHHTGGPGNMWWLLLWGVLQACPTQGSVLLAQPLPQKLTSPEYPEPYVKGQESFTDIEAPEGFAVKLIFQDFDLEPSPDCEQDSVTITASGMDPSRFCGQQGSPLGSPPGEKAFVSLGNSLRLTFRASASSEDRPPNLHKGFLALYQAVGVNPSQPISQASGGPEAINTPEGNPAKTQSHCKEPYYQPMAAETLTCTTQVPWKQTQEKEVVPGCVPVCGRPVTPIAQNREPLGASKAALGSFPWQAFTSIYGRGGGALLGDRWILTAAHTIYPKDGIFLGRRRSAEVFLGHTDIDEMLRLGGYPVRRVVVHPDYRQDEPRNFHGDIALLELQHRVPLGPSLLPVCLPDREALYRPGLLGYVSGFGVEMGWLTTELKYSRLPVAPRAACEAWLREKGRTEVFSAGMFCAGDRMRQQSVCQGDSGGAYVVWDDRARHWVATGIVSWGIGCGEGYGFYTKVLNYVDWIRRVMDGKD